MALNRLNFRRAEYGGEPVPLDHCVFCGRGIAGEFYRTNGDLTCTMCAAHMQSVLPKDTRETFWRSTGFGVLVAVAASLVYLLLFRLMAQYGDAEDTAIAAIGVGYAIGHAMRWAGPGARGRRYQVMAAVLTYAAVALASGAAISGLEGVQVWAYPFLVLTPVAGLFLGHFQQEAFLLFFVAIGIRWAWLQLQSHGIKISGPETLSDARVQAGERENPEI